MTRERGGPEQEDQDTYISDSLCCDVSPRSVWSYDFQVRFASRIVLEVCKDQEWSSTAVHEDWHFHLGWMEVCVKTGLWRGTCFIPLTLVFLFFFFLNHYNKHKKEKQILQTVPETDWGILLLPSGWQLNFIRPLSTICLSVSFLNQTFLMTYKGVTVNLQETKTSYCPSHNTKKIKFSLTANCCLKCVKIFPVHMFGEFTSPPPHHNFQRIEDARWSISMVSLVTTQEGNWYIVNIAIFH